MTRLAGRLLSVNVGGRRGVEWEGKTVRTGPAMPSLLVTHHRPGFYLRVLEEGEVQAGDAILRVGADPEWLTIAQVDGLLCLPNRSRTLLDRVARVPALSDGWKASFRELVAKRDGAAAAPAWTGFRPLRVVEVRC